MKIKVIVNTLFIYVMLLAQASLAAPPRPGEGHGAAHSFSPQIHSISPPAGHQTFVFPHPSNASPVMPSPGTQRWSGTWHDGHEHEHHHHHNTFSITVYPYLYPYHYNNNYSYDYNDEPFCNDNTIYYYYNETGKVLYTYDANCNIVYLNE